MLVVLCQMASVLLTSTAIVREKENGTIEQLFMTPVSARELIVGKLAPYLFFAGVQFCILAMVMRVVFDVPFNGPFFVLLGIFQLFVLAMMGLGLAISIRAPTREAAEQAAIGTVIPSIFLSGYIFRSTRCRRSFIILVSHPDDLDDRHRPGGHPARRGA